jgi:hypothetical protein
MDNEEIGSNAYGSIVIFITGKHSIYCLIWVDRNGVCNL